MAARPPMEAAQNAQPGDMLVVVHAFEARSPDELSLAKGERIELVEKDDDFGDGWYMGKNLVDGRSGLFPEVYTKLAPPEASGGTRQQRSSSTPNTRPPMSNDAGASSSMATSAVSQTYATQYDTAPQPLNTAPLYSTNTTQRTVSVPPSAFSSPTVSSAPPAQRSISLMMEGGRHIDESSPVLNETLSVIDEHITDMNTPRSSLFAHDLQPLHESGGDYSSHPHRMSYINGNETDEEERNAYSMPEVSRWTAAQVAEFLEDIGVERQHCQVFLEQEITGEVLLNLDQASVFMKELELGVVGRRLRTWQKIKNFQDEVRSASRRSGGKHGSLNQAQPANINAPLPPLPGANQPWQSSPLAMSHSPHGSKGSMRGTPLSTTRDSNGQSLGQGADTGHVDRRHVSLDAQPKLSHTPVSEGIPTATSPTGHNKQPSLDRNWTMSGSGSPAPTRSSFLGVSVRSRTGSTVDLESTSDSTRDLDRGYLSGSEVDNRKHRNVLRKRDAAGSSHSRQSSYKEATTANAATKRHSRFGSAGSFIAAITSAGTKPSDDPNAIKYLGTDEKEPLMIGGSPVVTRLEYDSPQTTAVVRNRNSQHADSSRSSLNQSLSAKVPADSAVARGDEKSSLSSTVATSTARDSASKDAPLQSPTRTTSTSKSMESDQPKGKITPGLTPTSSNRRSKNKKDTSAYRSGLLKKTPREAMAECDYSGWMKKKAPSLIATWKPRLFVLRGRRLSYYYSENDTEEQGLIDISNHKVLPADDLLTGIHATVTGAKSTPTSPANAQTETMNEAEVAAEKEHLHRAPASDGIFIFKLVPPRAGLSRAVNFTKPTVHYFAVDNIRQGRLWMAALMKATIQMDNTKAMVTTYSQKTISLAKAQQMKQRPPNLQDVDEGPESVAASGTGNTARENADAEDTGLKIQGLDMDYEYLPQGNAHETSGNGEREAEDGPNSAPLLSRMRASDSNPGIRGGRSTASYQEGKNSLRLVRSLSGGLSQAGRHTEDEQDPDEPSLYEAPTSRPSTSASQRSQGNRGPMGDQHVGDQNVDALSAARAAMTYAG